MQGVGIDISSTGRHRRLLERYGARFVARVLSPDERTRFARSGDAEFVASRWCAKEALLKAVGAPRGLHLPMSGVQVVSDGGTPRFEALTDAWRRQMETRTVLLSISHEPEGMAAAVVFVSARV